VSLSIAPPNPSPNLALPHAPDFAIPSAHHGYNLTVPPPPPPLFKTRLPPQHMPHQAKHFPRNSQALMKADRVDPLNPEKDLDLNRRQEQIKPVITISAEPKLRDLQKELVHMVPSTILRNQAKK
jgi:hypothetical protein